MRIPKWIHPDDYSKEACAARAELHFDMQQITGGRGFRQPKSSRKRAKQCGPITRETRLELMSRWGGLT